MIWRADLWSSCATGSQHGLKIVWSAVTADFLDNVLTVWNAVTAFTLSDVDAAVGGATSGAVPGALVIPAGLLNNTSPIPIELPTPIEQVILAFNLRASSQTEAQHAVASTGSALHS